MRIIPAIDIIDGKCVRLVQGDFSKKKIYNENPLEVAKQFADNGMCYLHLVDLDGARSGRIVNYQWLNRIASNTSLKVDFGVGIKSEADVNIALENGASQITCGSVASTNPDLFNQWLKKYGSEKIILGADCKNGKIAYGGWLQQTKTDVVDFIIAYQKAGVSYVICTEIGCDGMLQGPDVALYKEILKKAKVNLVASGGVSCKEDLIKLGEAGCEGAIIGKAIYEEKIKLKDLRLLC